MKRYILSLFISIAGFFSAFGMSFSEAQEHAYYLTDKMAYELDLTPDQYDLVYQVNLEYLLNVRTSNPYNYYWDYRNTDLSYILFDWQYSLYRAADYFYRPIVRRHHAWYFPLWDRYHRTYYYYSRPTIYSTWHGGLWHNRTHHTPSPFYGHRPPTHVGGMAGHGGHPHTGHPGYNGGYHGNGGNHGNGGYHGNNGHHNNGGARPGGNTGGVIPGHNGGNHGTTDGARPGSNGGSRPSGNGGYHGNSGSRGGYSGSSSRGGSSSYSRGGSSSSSHGTSASPSGSRGGSSSRAGNGGRSFGGGNHR